MNQFLRRHKAFFAVVTILFVAWSFSALTWQSAEARSFHSEEELLRLHELAATLPTDTNSIFAGSGKCGGCHGHDPQGIAFVTQSGEDVNIADDWAGTMMANSAKDPFWRAKVTHEILVNPAIADDIENTCTRCHAPAGRFEAELQGQLPYHLSDVESDSIAMDGVNCTVCHQIKDTLAGNNFNGNLFFTDRIAFGPYEDPVSAIMEFFVGWVPVYSEHITKSELCGGCHSLITHSHDFSGNPTGNSFFEQATYHEWKNSIYSALDSTCQGCHIPRITDTIDIATNYPFLDGRTPFGKHHLVGGNEFMIRLMKQNMIGVHATATSVNYDTSIARTARYLRHNTLDLNLQYVNRISDTAYYDVELTNKAGHKFPSGYPSRIAWVEFIVIDDQNDTIFWSGEYDGDGNVVNRDATWEPHRNVITSDDQVQIYEMVMGDVNDNPTTVLERADTVIKDNRIAPKGFMNAHASIDTMAIYGIGNDPDFNFSGVTEGTGGDIVHFHVPMNGYTGALRVRAKVWYHAVPRPWLDEMFAYNTPQIDSFRNFYNNADQAPSLVADAEIDDINLGGSLSHAQQELHFYPNPTSDGKIFVNGYQNFNVDLVRVFDLTGREVAEPVAGDQFNGVIILPERGVYLVVLETPQGAITRKVLWH